MADHGRTDGAQRESGGSADILVTRSGRTLAMLGPAGPARELSFLPGPDILPGVMPGTGPDPMPDAMPDTGSGLSVLPQKHLPVLIGSGTGAALDEIVSRLASVHGPDFLLAVVDKEEDILEASGLRERHADRPGILWIGQPGPKEAVNRLSLWQSEHGGPPLMPLLNPFYLRLDRNFYAAINEACAASAKVDFWSQARRPRFRESAPRILLLTSKYFLMGEIIAACERLEYPCHLLQIPDGEVGRSEFIESLLSAVLSFRPDFAFTINHLGVDREGVLTDLLEKLRLPLASWFVDNPHLVLYLYSRLKSPWLSIFTWDADNIASLESLGFAHVSYLPLGVDVTRFHPPKRGTPSFPGLPEKWDGSLSFVGNSMVNKVSARIQRAELPAALLRDYQAVAAGFAAGDDRSVRAYLEHSHPGLMPHFNALPDVEQQLAYEAMITWEATLQYRLSCVRGILPFAPLIVGDKGWKELLRKGDRWQYHSELNYYDDLPRFYPCSSINFNCTSKQMKGAVNQRIFDVPATGAFLLTDYREQVENLFEPGREIVCYHSPEEAASLAGEYLARPDRRRAIAGAARERILREHTYDHRVRSLVERMRALYA